MDCLLLCFGSSLQILASLYKVFSEKSEENKQKRKKQASKSKKTVSGRKYKASSENTKAPEKSNPSSEKSKAPERSKASSGKSKAPEKRKASSENSKAPEKKSKTSSEKTKAPENNKASSEKSKAPGVFEESNSHEEEISGPKSKEEHLLQMLGDYKFLATIYVLMDVIPVVAQLNLIFQTKQVDIAAIKPAVDKVITAVDKACSGKGYYQNLFREHTNIKEGKAFYKNNTEFVVFNESSVNERRDVRNAFCNKLKENILCRFPDTNFVAKFGVLGMRPLEFLTQEEVDNYGESEIRELASFYGALISAEATRSEWKLAKETVLQNQYPRRDTNKLWKIMYEYHSDSFPNMFMLARIALVLPLQTADVERAFSVQNLIVTSQRNKLKAETVDKLMTINMEGPGVEHFDYEAAAEHWRDVKKRNLYK